MTSRLVVRLGFVAVGFGVALATAVAGCEDECSYDNDVELAQETSGVEVTLRGITASAGAHAVAVGDAGTILRRTGEDAWSVIASGVTVDLFAVASPQPLSSTMVAVGAGGTLLRSVDDGETWKAIASGTTADLHAVWLAEDGGLALAAGDGVVLRSDNAGFTWSMGQVPEDIGVLRAIAGREGELVAVGDGGLALGSGDDGQTWARIETTMDVDLRAIAFDRYDLPVGTGEEHFLVSGGASVFWLADMRWQSSIAGGSDDVLGLSADGAWWVGSKGTVQYWPTRNFAPASPGDWRPRTALRGVAGSRTQAFAVGDGGMIVRASLLELGCLKGHPVD